MAHGGLLSKEGGLRVPLIIVWPRAVEAGRVTSEPVTSPDFYPTLLDAAGLAPLPEQHCDGKSFISLLNGNGEFERGPIFWHFPHYGNHGGTPGASVRHKEWKLIHFFEDAHEELFNLVEDVNASTDLAESHPEVRRKISDSLIRWQHSVGACIPTRNADYRGWPDREPSGHFAP